MSEMRDPLDLQVEALRAFVLLYRRTYMETQVHPSIIAENDAMMAARELCEKFNIK